MGSRNGFIEEAKLVFQANSTQGDYHGQINSDNFERWFRTQVLPNLPPASIVVMDNAPYHSRQIDKVPSRYDTKASMISWLQKRGIPCTMDARKTEIYSLIAANKPRNKTFAIDLLASENGHTVVRLPPLQL